MIPKKLTEELDNLSSYGDGELILHDQEIVWRLQIADGQLLYASDGIHSVRRWHRALKLNYPKWNWKTASSQISDHQNWECQILNQGIKQNQLSLIRAKLVIRSVIQECLFDLTRCSDLQSNWKPSSQLRIPFCQSAALSAWEIKTLLGRAVKLQEEWQSANLSHLSPNLSPILSQAAEPETLPVSRQYLTGEATLWDIALQLKKTIAVVTQALIPLVQKNILQFQEIPDLPAPTIKKTKNLSIATAKQVSSLVGSPIKKQAISTVSPGSGAAEPLKVVHKQSIIACIDDSPVITHTLRRILAPAGYRMLSIQEPMRGFAKLIEYKPDLILLDLLLPNADGYSICSFLRNTPVFAKTPIIILTAQNTLVDRSRAINHGATGFLVKPPQPDELLQMVRKYLAH